MWSCWNNWKKFKKISSSGITRKNQLSLLYQIRKFDTFLIVLGLIKTWNLIEQPSNYFLCYITISSMFCSPLFLIFRKIFMVIMMILTFFIFFFLKKIAFCFFLLHKDSDTFPKLLYEAFLWIFNSIQFPFLYMWFDWFFIHFKILMLRFK